MKRLSWVVAGVVTVLLVLVAGILLQMPAPEELGQGLMNRLSSAADVEFSAEAFESEIFGALTARSVKTSGTFRGGRFDATIGEMIFDFDLQSKLLGQPVLKGIHLREPRVTLTLADNVTDTATAGDSSLPDDSENLDLAGDQPDTVHFLVELGELRVLEELTDGSMIDRLTLLDIGAAFDGINLNDTGNSVIRRITASGILEAKSVQLSALVFDRVYSEFQLQNGIIKSTELRLFSELGTLQTSILLDLAQLPIEYEFTIEGEGLEAGVLLGQDPGGPAGEASLTLQGEGKGLSRERFSATGTLDLSGGALPPHPVLNDVAAVLNLAPLAGAEFSSTSTTLSVGSGQIQLDGLVLVTEKVGLGLTGWTDGNNRIQLQLGVHTQRAGLQVPRIPPAALDMATEADGWIDVPVNVTGTLETPRASIDTAALLSQISTKKGRYGQMARYLEPVE